MRSSVEVLVARASPRKVSSIKASKARMRANPACESLWGRRVSVMSSPLKGMARLSSEPLPLEGGGAVEVDQGGARGSRAGERSAHVGPARRARLLPLELAPFGAGDEGDPDLVDEGGEIVVLDQGRTGQDPRVGRARLRVLHFQVLDAAGDRLVLLDARHEERGVVRRKSLEH